MATYKGLPEDLFGRVTDFLDLNSLLAWRIAQKAHADMLEESPVWRKSGVLAQSEARGEHVKVSFRTLLFKSKMEKRWRSDRPRRTAFKIDVFGRVKGGNQASSRSPHLLVERDRVTVVQPPQINSFPLKRVFSTETEQNEVYSTVMEELVVDALCGFSSTVFFYGQTGSGKTHTCLGAGECSLDGLLPETIRAILRCPDAFLYMKVLEIYCENIVFLCEEVAIRDYERDAVPLLLKVLRERSTRSTVSNARSSRSHAIFTMDLCMRRGTSTIDSRIELVDLAGAERQSIFSDIEAERETIREAGKINQSLTALGRVIHALAQVPRPPHIPYRDSKLTMLLKPCLGGTLYGQRALKGVGRVAFILTLSSEEVHARETIATLRFGERAQQVVFNGALDKEGSKRIATYSELLRRKHELESGISHLRRVWQSCGQDRHGAGCRCDKCLGASTRADEPFHIPKYCRWVEEHSRLVQMVEQFRTGTLSANQIAEALHHNLE